MAVGVSAFFAIAGNKANPDAVELAPLPLPIEFKSDMDAPVPFDAATKVVVECPDAAAAEWLTTHFRDWYGEYAPKVTGLRVSPSAASSRMTLVPRVMMWHDMLLERGDPRWKGYIHFGSKTTATLAETLPKDVIICDWQYYDMKEKNKAWPTMAYFNERGFPVVGCPFTNFNAMRPMADFISKIGGFGFIQTTWHHLRGADWVKMYRHGSSAAWGSAIRPSAPMYDTTFGNALRFVGHDMKVTDYLDTGHLNYQVSPAWWMN